MLTTSTLRPGFLVSLKTSVSGNVSYDRRDIESAYINDVGHRKARWETERTVQDPVEHEKALEARSKAATLVRRVCARSAFGLLCPETAADDLERAIADARKVAEEFNATASLTRVQVYVMTGRIAPDDVEAVKAINSEIRDLLEEMQDGVQKLDVKRIRDAAGRARQLGSMLSIEAATRVQIAIDAARTAARRIVSAGEEAAQEIDTNTIARLRETRTAFLDIDDAQEVRTPTTQGRGIDLEPIAEIKSAAVTQRAMEL